MVHGGLLLSLRRTSGLTNEQDNRPILTTQRGQKNALA